MGRRGGYRRRRDTVQCGQGPTLWWQRRLLRVDRRGCFQCQRAAVHFARGQSARRRFGRVALGGQSLDVGQIIGAVEDS